MLKDNETYMYKCLGCGNKTDYDVWDCKICFGQDIIQIIIDKETRETIKVIKID